MRGSCGIRPCVCAQLGPPPPRPTRNPPQAPCQCDTISTLSPGRSLPTLPWPVRTTRAQGWVQACPLENSVPRGLPGFLQSPHHPSFCPRRTQAQPTLTGNTHNNLRAKQVAAAKGPHLRSRSQSRRACAQTAEHPAEGDLGRPGAQQTRLGLLVFHVHIYFIQTPFVSQPHLPRFGAGQQVTRF